MSDKNKLKRQRLKANRRLRMKEHTFEGWKQCSEFHYQRAIDGEMVNWWPTRRKCQIRQSVFSVHDESDIMHLISQLPPKEKAAS